MIEWYLMPWRSFNKMSGRSARHETWTFVLVNAAIMMVISMAAGQYSALAIIFQLVICIPTFCVVTRRLHDTGRSAWWHCILFLPFIGFFILLYFLFLPSDEGENEYGPMPEHQINEA